MIELLTIIDKTEDREKIIETSNGLFLCYEKYTHEQLELFRIEAEFYCLEEKHDFDYESSSDAGMGIETSYTSYTSIEIKDDMYVIKDKKLEGFYYLNNAYLFDGMDSNQKLNVDYSGKNYHHYDATTVSIKRKGS